MVRTSRSNARDATALAALVGVGAVAVAITDIARWTRALARLGDRVVADPAAVAVVAVVALTVAGAVVARRVLTRRLLADRVTLAVLPSESLDPSPEAVVSLAALLGRVRTGWIGLLAPRACAVRLAVRSLPGGRLLYTVCVQRRALPVLRASLAVYGGVELRDPAPLTVDTDDSGAAGVAWTAAAGEGAGWGVARAELVLARRASLPLADRGLRPDPLTPIARVYESLRDDLGEQAVVALDVLPATPGQRRRLHARLVREARRHTAAGDEPTTLAGMLRGTDSRRRAAPVELVQRRAQTGGLAIKLAAGEPLLHVQLLLRVRSRVDGRARALLAALLGCFDVFAGENHWRARGIGVAGLVFWGADRLGSRGRFEQRLESGRFAAPRRNVVSAREVAGLLKPPTVHCPATNVLRVPGTVAGAPPGLPTFDVREAGLVPLGRVRGERGERVVGLRLADTFFCYTAGRSRYGKTELAIGQFVHLAHCGHGALFLDPHEDAITRIKSYLTDPRLAERVVEINLAGAAARGRQPGWNLFSTVGLDAAAAEGRVEAVVDAFASALRWDERNNRALTLTAQAAQALVELARRLPEGLAPTIFQIPTLLGNEQWRIRVLPFLSPVTRQFFLERFPRMPDEAITPVTNLIDRLRTSTPVAGLLGCSRSGYRIRDAMDQGRIVLACPGSGTTRDRLIANFLVYDLLHAAIGRAELPPARRRPFYVFLDEVQTYDGASGGNLAALLEQTAKYGIRAFLLNQNPERLTQATLNAITTNRSHLITTVLNSHAAGLLAREWGGTPDAATITGLRRHHFLAAITLGQHTPPPFEIEGVLVDELYPDHHHPDQVERLEQTIDRTMARRPVNDTLAELDRLDQAILDHLTRERTNASHAGVIDARDGVVPPELPPRPESR